MVIRKPRRKTDIKGLYFKLLESAQKEYPNLDKKALQEIAAKRANTWLKFIENPESGTPLLPLFADLGELSNLRITDVRISYPTEPMVDVDYDFRGERAWSNLTYEEALRELEFALKNDVVGAEKLRNTMERLEAEMIDKRKVRKVGNSLVVSVPESIISLFGLSDGDYLSFIYRFGEVKIKKSSAE